MSGCTPNCGFCGGCTERWERDMSDDDTDEPDYDDDEKSMLCPECGCDLQTEYHYEECSCWSYWGDDDY